MGLSQTLSFRHFTLQMCSPLYLGGCSDLVPTLSSMEMGLTVLPGLWDLLSGSLSSPGHTANLQMLAYGIQQRMSPLSCHW